MKIFFPMAAFYPSQIGGPCNTVFWHTQALTKNGYDVTVVTTDFGIKDKQGIKDDAFELKSCGMVYYGSGGVRNPKTYRTILSVIGKQDILHLNSLFSFFSIISFFYSKIFYPSKPVVWSVRGELNKNALIYSTKKKKVLLGLYRKLGKNIVFHSTSESETNDIATLFPGFDQFMIPNYIQPNPRISPPIAKQILYIGRIHPIKGLTKLIEALSLSQSFLKSEFKLVLAGKHEERHAYYLEELKNDIEKYGLQDKVSFAGHVEGTAKETFYAASYCLVLPSETENFGNVVVEALNQGTPVIASTGTPWKILETYHCGLHVSNEPLSLAKAIDTMLGLNENVYGEMRRNAQKLVDAEFNIETQISKWINQYEHIKNAKK